MFWLFYNTVFLAAFLLLLPRFFYRMRRRGGYGPHFMQRLGWYDPAVKSALAGGGRIWIHAVSVGEVHVAFRFMEKWRDKFPGARFVLSLTTSTADKIARAQCRPEDVVMYFPVDFPPVMRRVVRLIQPRALVLVECEFWPNLLRLLNRGNIPVALINGRVSDRSYPRYRKVRFLTRRVMPLIDLFCMQSKQDRDRMVAICAPEDRVHVLQSAKYEVAQRNPAGEATAVSLLERAGFGPDSVKLLGGSTWPGEEVILVRHYQALKARYPNLRLILVPRHAERVPQLLKELAPFGLSVVRRSELPGAVGIGAPDIFLLDTTGELMNFYHAADLIFVGKSLSSKGGQNPIEPALHGKPVIVGPHMQNFTRVIRDFREANAIYQVRDELELGSCLSELLGTMDEAAQTGARARALVERNANALSRTVDMVASLIEAKI